MSTLSVAVIRDVQSFDFSNTEFAKAFDVANAAFDQSNTAAIIANTTNTFAYGVAVNAAAAFAAANNVGPQIAPAFNKANNALANTSGTFAGILTVSGASLNVVGGANPYYALNDSANGTSYLQIASGVTNLYGGGSQPVSFSTNGTTRVLINASGNVGIGTTSPSYKLDVTGTVNAASLLVNGSAAVTSTTSPWVLVGSVTATNGAAIQNTTFLTSSYGRYMFVIRDVFTITNATTIFMQFYSGGAYQTANYYAAGTVLQTAGYTNMPLTTALYLSYPSQSSSVHPYYGIIHMLNPASTTYYKPYFGQGTVFNGTSQMNTYHYGGGWQGGTGAITGFQVYAGSGNITGTVQVYGAV
jgi:hypothetical protein